MKYTYRNFYSSINKMPRIGESGHTFLAKVDVEVPSGGHSVSLVKDRVVGDTIYLRIDVSPPEGAASQAFETLTSRYDEPLTQEYKKAVLLGVIDEGDVQTTH